MSAIDWSTKPAPWRWIGPQFRAECEQIVAGKVPEFQNHNAVREESALAALNAPRQQQKMRKHRPAVGPNPQQVAASAERQVEVAQTKAVLQTEHDLRAAGTKRLGRGHYRRAGIFDDEDQDEIAAAIIAAARLA